MRITGMDAVPVISKTTSDIKGVSNSDNDFPGLRMTRSTEAREIAVQRRNADENREAPVDEGEVSEAVKKMNKILEGTSRRFEFTAHDKIPGIIITVIDNVTNEVIREVPPKKILDMIANMMEMAGLLVDERR